MHNHVMYTSFNLLLQMLSTSRWNVAWWSIIQCTITAKISEILSPQNVGNYMLKCIQPYESTPKCLNSFDVLSYIFEGWNSSKMGETFLSRGYCLINGGKLVWIMVIDSAHHWKCSFLMRNLLLTKVFMNHSCAYIHCIIHWTN